MRLCRICAQEDSSQIARSVRHVFLFRVQAVMTTNLRGLSPTGFFGASWLLDAGERAPIPRDQPAPPWAFRYRAVVKRTAILYRFCLSYVHQGLGRTYYSSTVHPTTAVMT
jgi:hypothetical protein